MIWESPPSRRPQRYARQEAFEGAATAAFTSLRKRPGKWARVCTYASPTRAWGAARSIRERQLMPGCQIVPGKCEAGSAVWARYIHAGYVQTEVSPATPPDVEEMRRQRAANAADVRADFVYGSAP